MAHSDEQRNTLTGIIGTVAFHLLLLFVFLTVKIGKVKNEHREVLQIEFAELELSGELKPFEILAAELSSIFLPTL